MVTPLIAAALTAALLNSTAIDTQEDGTEPRLTALHLPRIVAISITANGARAVAAGGSGDACARFVLKDQDVKRFLRTTREVSEHDYLHTLDWSPCYASGKVKFKDGTTATWGIHQLRGGSLTFSSGRVIYLFCADCQGKPFLPTHP